VKEVSKGSKGKQGQKVRKEILAPKVYKEKLVLREKGVLRGLQERRV